jgi:hypothetical protein
MLAPAVQWRKEVRELLPWWSVTVAMMAASWALMHPDALPLDSIYSWTIVQDRSSLLSIGLATYATGALTLGALSIGHEYSHGTLTQLLAQPVARAHVLQVKLLVLAPMMLLLGALAVGAWGEENLLAGLHPLRLALVPLAGGLFLTPWLTMVGRGPLAGVVFTLALFSIVWLVSFHLRSNYLWFGTTVLGVAGAVMTWRTFLRLEATGGTEAEVDFGAWFSRPSVETRAARLGQNRVWLLVKKEMRLQQATFLVSGLYVAVWVMVVAGRRYGGDASADSPLAVAAFLNACLVPLLSGAVMSAEERRLGTAAWHTLLPLAAWKQWAVKASVAVGSTLVLAVVLPSFLGTIAAAPGVRGGMEPMTAVVLCVTAAYVSSLSTTSLRALLFTGPVVVVAFFLALNVGWPLVRIAQPAIRWLVQALPIVKIPDPSYVWWAGYDVELAAGGLALLLLRFGLANHRSADRSRGRTARQFAWISAYGATAWLLMSFASNLIVRWLLAAQGR